MTDNETHTPPNHIDSRAWLWVPTLYFAEGVPYFIVNNVSVMMLTRMGVPNGVMALYTSLLYLPWVIKPLWSPFVDIIRTKRWWVLAMQVLLTAAFVGMTLTLPHPPAETIGAGATGIGLFRGMLILFWLSAFAGATHDIAADGYYMLALDTRSQSFYVGVRSLFYRLSSIFGQGVLIWLAGRWEEQTGDIPAAWQRTLLCASLLFAALTVWHLLTLPRKEQPAATEQRRATDILRDFGETFVSFFRKDGILLALCFMLLYRLPEAFLVKMLNPFFVGSVEHGGLGLSTADVGWLYGVLGVAGLTAGGLLGGFYASRYGLRRSLIPMVLAITLPDAVYLWMSLAQPAQTGWVAAAITFEQFGYGFGFTAYMLYLMHFSRGERQTSHYALCTGFMALGMMLPGMAAGYIQEALGYTGFFWLVIACCALSIAVTILLRKRLKTKAANGPGTDLEQT
ncbi:MAG: MFS transporter [Paludibacteraceae bacterium]|nr:MFS transporter [Paludibacteraceae bacterium]